MDNTKRDQLPNSVDSASFWSKLLFIPSIQLYIKVYKTGFNIEDICDPPKSERSEILGSKLERIWKEHLDECNNSKKAPSFTRILFKTFKKELFITGLLTLIIEVFIKLSQPVIFKLFLSYFTPNSTTTENQAILYGCLMAMLNVFSVVFSCHSLEQVYNLKRKVKIAISSLVYRKILKLNKHSLDENASGKILGLISKDVDRFDTIFIFIHYIWVVPIAFIATSVLIWLQVGYHGLIGMCGFIIALPLLILCENIASVYHSKAALSTDKRVTLTEEIMSSIEVIKMCTWEKIFTKMLDLPRKFELNKLGKFLFFRAVNNAISLSSTRISLFISILAIVFLDGQLTTGTVYVMTSYLSLLATTVLFHFRIGISEIYDIHTTIRRLESFLISEEFVSLKDKSTDNNTENLKYSIKLVNYNGKWGTSASHNSIENINLCIMKGDLVAIIGPVGCGKSTLLNALLNELTLTSGSIIVNGSVSYVCQEAWIFAGSVRQNILFGQVFDEEKYTQVIEVCALVTDLKQLPNGDMTLIGDKGISLSGGQKARITLARAMYKDADIYLLDDCLSAVDTHVGKHIFNKCIIDYLKSKTVVVVTHQLQFLKNFDHIVLMNNGKIELTGTYTNIVNSSNKYTNNLRKEKSKNKIENNSNSPIMKEIPEYNLDSSNLSKNTDLNNLEEILAEGVVFRYIKLIRNRFLIIFVVFLFIVNQFFINAFDYVVSIWANYGEQMQLQNSTINLELIEYSHGGIVVGIIFFSLISAIIFYYLSIRFARIIHCLMFNSVIRTAMQFFYKNQIGRIMNRFSTDVGFLDETFPKLLFEMMQQLPMVIGICVLTSIANIYSIIIIIVLLGLFYIAIKLYDKISRDINQLSFITRSPIFIQFNSTFQGLTTIRTLGVHEKLIEEFDNHQNLYNGSCFLSNYATVAYTNCILMLCSLFLFTVIIIFLAMGDSVDGGSVGLAITQIMLLLSTIQFTLRSLSTLKNGFISIQRIIDYINLEPEKKLESGDKKSPEKWPQFGQILFRNTYLKYQESQPYVLQNLNITINAKEKIGIVGRTGAGKSSLISALFRLSHIEGDIIIDGINTKDISLHDLRSKISIIPQQPFLFSGTLRKNLDPFDEYPDFLLWKVLEEVELKDAFYSKRLDQGVLEQGSNFSIGQKQLLCLARAILRNNKILIMDEATANVDPQTDQLIQNTIKKKFSHCTVLTIAHRLNTIMDSDKVIVMDAGRMVQFDHPHILCQNTEGHFYKLMFETDTSMADHLSKVALQSYKSKFGETTVL